MGEKPGKPVSHSNEKNGQIRLQTVDFFDIIRIWHILALQKAAPKVREEVKE